MSPICSFKLIFWVRHGELFLFQYIYIYFYHMHGWLLCAFVLYCAKPSPRRSRIPGRPDPWRSMVMIGGVRPQFSIYARETFPFGGFATLSASKYQNVCTHMIIISHILSTTEKAFTEKKSMTILPHTHPNLQLHVFDSLLQAMAVQWIVGNLL